MKEERSGNEGERGGRQKKCVHMIVHERNCV